MYNCVLTGTLINLQQGGEVAVDSQLTATNVASLNLDAAPKICPTTIWK
jgi:hypothetical protein